MKDIPTQVNRIRLKKLGVPFYKHDLAGLSEVLPFKIGHAFLHIHKGVDFWLVMYGGDYNVEDDNYFKEKDPELADALALMVCYLREQEII